MKNIKKLGLVLLGVTIFHIGIINCQPKDKISSTKTTSTWKDFAESCKEIKKGVKSIYKSILTGTALLIIMQTLRDYKDYTKHGDPTALILNGVMLSSIAVPWYKIGLGYPFIDEL